MLKNYAVASLNIDTLHIKDIGEEESACGVPTPKQRNCYIIHFVVDGAGTYNTFSASAETQSQVKSGNAFAIFRGETVSYTPNKKDPFYYFWVGFDGAESEKIMDYVGFTRDHPTMKFDNVEEIAEAFRKMFTTWKNNDKYSLIIDFLSLIRSLRKNCISQVRNILLQNENKALIKAEQYIQAHITENLSIDNIAASVYLTRSHFSRIFKAHFKITPHEYIVKLRLRNAEILLRTSDYSIKQIVELLNFTDVYSFSKQFKKYYRFPPAEFRKKNFTSKNYV